MACYRLVFASLLPPFMAETSRKVAESSLDSLVYCKVPEQVRDSEKAYIALADLPRDSAI
jgi:hypothetical protein